MSSDQEIIPADDGTLVAEAKARIAIESERQTSPENLLGKDLIRTIAEDLEKHREDGLPVITSELFVATLRSFTELAIDYANGSILPPEVAAGFSVQPSELSTALRPNAETAKKARRKLASVRNAIDGIEQSLSADEIAAFDVFSAEVLLDLRAEVDRLEASVEVPSGFKRGRPALANLASMLHLILFDLTGSWLRLRNVDEAFLPNVMHHILKPMVGSVFSDEEIGQTIETEIRRPKPKRQKAAT